MKKYFIPILFLTFAIISAFFIDKVKVNYNLEEYLPKNSEIRAGIDTYHDEFGHSSTTTFSFNEADIKQALLLKQKVMQVDNVVAVDYIDQYFNMVTYNIMAANLTTDQKAMMDNYMNNLLQSGLNYPEAFIALIQYMPTDYKIQFTDILNRYISEDAMLMNVVFSTDSSDVQTENSIEEIKTILDNSGYTYHFSGDATSSIFTRNIIEDEVGLITLICVPLILLLVLFFDKSYFDIIIFGIIIGISVIINLGTNAILPNISFITSSMTIVLQIAISLDYVIFLINAYHRERGKGIEVDEAIVKAKKASRKPIIASALTTTVSFLALAVMRFTIGFDIGIVFAKAIIISLLVTLFLLPEVIRMFSKYIDKTTKKRKTLMKGKLTKKLYPLRYVFLVLTFVVLAISLYSKTQTEFIYGSSVFSGNKDTIYGQDVAYIEDHFGKKNDMIIILPKNDVNELALYQELSQLDYVDQIQAGIYYKEIISDPMTLNMVTSSMYSSNYALINFNLLSDSEGTIAFQYYENIDTIIQNLNIQNAYILGETSVAYNIKKTVSVDYTLVIVLAIIAIMIVIFISFKNLFLPILLSTTILTSVWFTMMILQLISKDMEFLSNLIVSAILLGVTIDYAILLSKSFVEFRHTLPCEESIVKAIQNSAQSIITSAMVFSIAGLTIAVISSIQMISQIGIIIAVGALTSLFFILIVLPQLLGIFDKWIKKSKI